MSSGSNSIIHDEKYNTPAKKSLCAYAKSLMHNSSRRDTSTVVVSDEATSALDTLSEGVVQNALDKASAGKPISMESA